MEATWDESNDHLQLNTNDDGTTSGHVSIPSYVPIKSSKIIIGDNELNESTAATISGVTAGTSAANKAVVDSNLHIDNIKTTSLY